MFKWDFGELIFFVCFVVIGGGGKLLLECCFVDDFFGLVEYRIFVLKVDCICL